MGKSTRGNTKSSSEFSGFAAFASHTSSASAALTRRAVQDQEQKQQQQQQSDKKQKKKKKNSKDEVASSPSSSSLSMAPVEHRDRSGAGAETGAGGTSSPNKTLKPNPIYTGNDSHLIQIFKRIGQKRDSTTKTRALSELISYAYPNDNKEHDKDSRSNIKKADQILALSHYFFLFSNKLIHDNNSSVRSEALRVLGCAIDHVPKAFRTLLLHGTSSTGTSIRSACCAAGEYNSSSFDIGSIGNIIGWVYTSNNSQIMEVSRIAKHVWVKITTLLEEQTSLVPSPKQFIQQQMTSHVESILQNSSRATNLADAFSVLGNNNNSSSTNKSNSNQKQQGGGKGGNNSNKNKSITPPTNNNNYINESDLEEMEERYERVVLHTIHGMSHFLTIYSENNDNNETTSCTIQPYETQFKNSSVLWKHLSNTRGNFRRASYVLLASICQHASSIIHPLPSDSSINTVSSKPHNLSTLITKSLSSEKDPSNIPSLFELILLYIASFRKYGDKKSVWIVPTTTDIGTTTSSRSCCAGLNAPEFIKTLIKVLRRACHGSPSSQWGPSMLPLTVSLPSMESQLQILAALWSGRTSALNAVDAAYIVSAVSECATYLLLQSNDNDDENGSIDELDFQLSMEIAQAFLESFSYYLTTPSSGSAARVAEEHLKMTIVKDVHKLDTLGSTKVNCYFIHIRQWFWKEGINKVLITNDEQLSMEMLQRLENFIYCIMKTRSSASKDDGYDTTGGVASNLHPVLQVLFWTKLQPKEAEIPTAEEVSLMVSIIKFCSLSGIFCDDSGSVSIAAIEHFCASALLNWILYYFMTNGDAYQFENDLIPLFKMLSLMLQEVQRKGLLWESLLKEIENTGTNLKKLRIGLKVLTANMDAQSSEHLICGTLDSIAVQAATTMLKDRGAKIVSDDGRENEMEESTDESSILRVCIGIEAGISKSLLSSNAIITLIDLCDSKEYRIPYEHINPLLEILLICCSQSLCTINEEKIVQLLIACWKQGSKAWNMKYVQILMGTNSLTYTEFISSASLILRSDIRRTIGENEDVELASLIWSERAWRFIHTLNHHRDTSKNVAELLGLDDSSTWKVAVNNVSMKQSDFLYKSLGRLLEKYPNVKERNILISHLESGEKDLSIFVLILMVLARGVGSNGFTIDAMYRCDQLSSLLGNVGSQWSCKELLSKIISTLSYFIKVTSTENELQLGVMVLDWAVSQNLKKIDVSNNSNCADIAADQVKVGDELWYIVDSTKEDSDRVKVCVETIHTDDYPNFYFTVRVGDTFKQTVPARLKYLPLPSKQLLNEHIPWLEETIAANLVKPYFLDNMQQKNETAAECLNIIISYCGLRGNAGIGSTRYDMFQFLTKLGQDALLKIQDEDLTLIASSLKRLSLALGYGAYTSPSKENAEIMKYPCDELMTALLDFYESDKGVLLTEGKLAMSLNPSIIMWLTVASSSTLNVSNAAQIWSLASSIVSEASVNNFYQKDQAWLNMIMKMFKSMKSASNRLPHDCIAVIMDAEESIMSKLILAFVKCKIEHYMYEVHTINRKPYWLQTFQSFAFESMENQSSSAVSYGAREQIEGLCECLLSPEKQICAFQLLSKATKRDYQLYRKDDNLHSSTCSRLDEWVKSCDEEEAAEIEEDVLVTGMWIPRNLMKALEEFGDDAASRVYDSEASLTGKFLQWLVCLELLDVAASSDMRNRTHIGSYVKLTGAIKFIVQNALQFATLEIRKGSDQDWLGCTSSHNEVDRIPLQQLATLVLFRSVETVPTLFKSWWNEDCPRSMQNLVNKFVEAMVAPETLRRELYRIRAATNLDEMSVSGSCVSREVVASYIQDECKLSVLIRIPSSFPLRNVEVDCRKTLGIPEKRWRHWALQIMLMLNSQDGSILDALLLWKQNVDKEFEGVEPCPVCYSVLCVKTHAMPNLECNTCHNRFHSSCLYKWFKSSGKNQCVLCQQPWSGTKVGK